MHSRRPHHSQRLNRVLQLPLKRPLIIHLLIKLTPHPVRLVEQLKSQPPRLRHTLCRDLHPCLIQHLRRNLHSCTIRGHLIRNPSRRQLLRNLLHILPIQPTEQNLPVRPPCEPRHARTNRRQESHRSEQPIPLPCRQRHHSLTQTTHH